nr:AidA/PixA family protein [uncultured Draconibacterium sp.]
MKTVNILIAVDTETLAGMLEDGELLPGSIDRPTGLGAWGGSDVFLSMVAQHSFATNNQGESELTVTCKSGDEIQWVIMGFDANSDYTVYLFDGHFNVSQGSGTASDYISKLSYNKLKVPNYFPPQDDPKGALTKCDNTIYATDAKLLSYGVTLQYTLSFALVDNSTGKAIGYFSWDPFIKIQG